METDKELSKLYEQKDNGNCEHEDIDQLINNKLHEHQLKNYEKKLSDLKRLKTEKGRSAGVFKLKEKIVGSKKTNQEAVTMKDPDSGELIMENEELKEASVRYVSNLLTNRCPLDDFKEEFIAMESLHNMRINYDPDSESSISKDDFEKFLKEIAKKN